MVDPEKVTQMAKLEEEADLTVPLEAAAELRKELEGSAETSRLDVIELWLAAHFATLIHRKSESTSWRGGSAKFQGRTDMGLNATLFGQQAVRLDASGILAAREKAAEKGAEPGIEFIY